MKRIIALVITMMIMTAGAAFSADLKIGVVDLQRAMNETQAGQKILSDLSAEMKGQEAELEKMKSDIARLEKELQSQSGIMTPEARDRKMLQLQDKRSAAEAFVQSANKRMDRKQELMRQRLVAELADTTRVLGKELGYSMIVEAQGGGVVYLDEALDITTLLIERFDKEWQKANGK